MSGRKRWIFCSLINRTVRGRFIPAPGTGYPGLPGPRLLPGKKHEGPVGIILKFYDPRGAFLRIRRRGEGVEESQLFKVIEIRSNGV